MVIRGESHTRANSVERARELCLCDAARAPAIVSVKINQVFSSSFFVVMKKKKKT